MLKEKGKEVVGDAIVQGTKEGLKKEIQENGKTYVKIGLGIIGAAAGINILFNIINAPRASRSNIHFYIHVI